MTRSPGSKYRLSCSIAASIGLLVLAGCRGTVMLDTALPATKKPLGLQAVAINQPVQLSLDRLVTSNGPGSWARNAPWDEYQFTISNRSPETITLQQLVLYDLQDTAVESHSDRRRLQKQSRANARHYRKLGMQRSAAGDGTGPFVAGSAATASGVATSIAGLSGSATAASAAGAVAIGVVAAPVLVAVGVVQASRARAVSRELRNRQVRLPLVLHPGSTLSFSAFFPVTPAPVRLDASYVTSSGVKQLSLDTRDTLQGLHLASTSN